MDCKVRPCTDKDVTQFKELFKQVEEYHRKRLPSRFRQPENGYAESLLKESLDKEDSQIFIAELDNEIVGYVRLMIKKMPNHPLIHPGKFISVEELAVDSKARRKKVGSTLMTYAEDYARRLGFSEIELNVWYFNNPAEKLYENLGYQKARTFLSKKL